MEDAPIGNNFMEEYASKKTSKNAYPLKNLEALKAKKNFKRSMVKFSRTQEEPHRTANRVSDYHKGKILETHNSRDNPRGDGGTPGRGGTLHDTDSPRRGGGTQLPPPVNQFQGLSYNLQCCH